MDPEKRGPRGALVTWTSCNFHPVVFVGGSDREHGRSRGRVLAQRRGIFFRVKDRRVVVALVHDDRQRRGRRFWRRAEVGRSQGQVELFSGLKSRPGRHPDDAQASVGLESKIIPRVPRDDVQFGLSVFPLILVRDGDRRDGRSHFGPDLDAGVGSRLVGQVTERDLGRVVVRVDQIHFDNGLENRGFFSSGIFRSLAYPQTYLCALLGLSPVGGNDQNGTHPATESREWPK